ncbi:MAG: nucleotidyl transferase AbiEii/AbiGii toxin family protein [Myxococcota bacterium]
MRFIHEDVEFSDLLRIVARDTGLSPALVEKDYWITHTLWALHQDSLEVWFKGGTSLSKGFGLIQRFSEDLDLKLEAGAISVFPVVTSWKSEGTGAVTARRLFFTQLEAQLNIPNVRVELDHNQQDPAARSAMLRAYYPGSFLEGLPPALRPFVLLEVGSARVSPYVERPIYSCVHQWLKVHHQSSEWVGNWPHAVRCVHPLVTLLEKLDAISRRYRRTQLEPAAFIRHYEDAAHIILESASLPKLEVGISELEQDMLRQRQLISPVSPEDPSLVLSDPERRKALEHAWMAIAPMFWGPRITLMRCCEVIREWLSVFRQRGTG